MFRTKVLIFMIPLVLPIGQPPAQAYERNAAVAAERVIASEAVEPVAVIDDSE